MNMSNRMDKERKMSVTKEDIAKDQLVTAEDEGPREYIVAVGLPKGWIYQEETHKLMGVIRIGGHLLDSLTPKAYTVWTKCLTPVIAAGNTAERMSSILGRYPKDCQLALDELFSRRCVARLQLGSRLSPEISDLKPIPSGYGSGNSSLTPEKYCVSGDSHAPVLLDVIGQALWSLMDGNLTLGEIAAEATEWLDIAPGLVEMGLIYTTVELMKGRCLYLDRTRRISGLRN